MGTGTGVGVVVGSGAGIYVIIGVGAGVVDNVGAGMEDGVVVGGFWRRWIFSYIEKLRNFHTCICSLVAIGQANCRVFWFLKEVYNI